MTQECPMDNTEELMDTETTEAIKLLQRQAASFVTLLSPSQKQEFSDLEELAMATYTIRLRALLKATHCQACKNTTTCNK